MKLFIGADHRGFKLKEQLVTDLPGIEDLGTDSKKPVDYPIISERVAKKVIETGGQGILLCGSGQGACIAANKIDGVRAAQAWDVKTARSARHDDDANILCLGADDMDPKKALKIIKTFLNASFDPAPRRQRRLKEIKKLERDI